VRHKSLREDVPAGLSLEFPLCGCVLTYVGNHQWDIKIIKTFITTSNSFYTDGVHVRTSQLPGDKKNDFCCNKSRSRLSYLDIFWWKSGHL
jgi:hypothetical protein